MPPSRIRWLVLCASSALSLTVGWVVLRNLRDDAVQPDVRFFPTPPAPDIDDPPPPPPGPTPESGVDPDPKRPEDWRYFLTEKAAQRIFRISSEDRNRYDPWTYFSDLPNQNTRHVWSERPEQEFWWRTNSLGLRDDDELTVPPAELRVLVTGDSHTVGACENRETFPALLQSRLAGLHSGKRVEVLNAALPGASFYQYAGTLHKFRDFAPQVFVVSVYGGNDFGEIIYLTHRFTGLPWKSWQPEQLALQQRALEESKFSMAQCFNTPFNFRCRPDERPLMLDTAVDLCRQMDEACARIGAALVVVYIPAACDCEWKPAHEDIDRGRAILGLTEEEAKLNAQIGQDFIAALGRRGIAVVDMQPVFAREAVPPYWRLDLHLNLAGHRLVAETLLPEIESLLAGRGR